MPNFLEFTLDKFTFKVATDRSYHQQGVWAKFEGQNVRVGLSDYWQQRNGDVCFAEVKATGAHLSFGEELANIETIKVDVELPSPVTGLLETVNPALEGEPEVINQDPYGAGWLALIEADEWPADRARLLDPDAYLAHIKAEAEAELG